MQRLGSDVVERIGHPFATLSGWPSLGHPLTLEMRSSVAAKVGGYVRHSAAQQDQQQQQPCPRVSH